MVSLFPTSLFTSALPPCLCLSVCLPLSVSAWVLLSSLFSLLSDVPPPSLRVATPPLAAWPLSGAALHQAGRLAVHQAVRGGSQPHAPVRWVPNPRLRPLPAPVGAAGLARTPQKLAFLPVGSSLRPCLCPLGNGDILSYEDANCAMQTGVTGIMIAR